MTGSPNWPRIPCVTRDDLELLGFPASVSWELGSQVCTTKSSLSVTGKDPQPQWARQTLQQLSRIFDPSNVFLSLHDMSRVAIYQCPSSPLGPVKSLGSLTLYLPTVELVLFWIK